MLKYARVEQFTSELDIDFSSGLLYIKEGHIKKFLHL